jgi:hypothetical protein
MADKPPLTDTHPHLARQADGWDPSRFVAGSALKMDWKCDLGHRWNQAIRERIRKNSRGLCPVCDNKVLLVGFNDFATTNPEMLIEVNGWDPHSLTNGSTKKVGWRCSQNHEWIATVHSRARVGTGCPYCSNSKLLTGFNDLLTVFPNMAAEADGWDPSLVLAGSKQKKKWRCLQGHKWSASVNSRTSRNTKCNVCNGRQVSPGFNDLATTHPELAREAHGWDPSTVVAGSNRKFSWICSKGHIWTASVESRAKLNRGCGVCSHNHVLRGFNDFATSHPEFVHMLVDADPGTFTAGSEKRLKWKCSLGHEWVTAAKHISRGQGCPYCANFKLLTGFNDFQTKFPAMALEADGWDPSKVVAGSAVKKKWKCPEGHRYTSLVSSRSSRNTGCPSCAQSGFDPNKDGWLYFLSHPDWDMLQIGITNVPDDRLRTHTKLGWQVLELRGPMNGELARQWETDILRMLKASNATLGNTAIAGKFTGYTESWMKGTYPVDSLKELMEAVRQVEWN